MYILPKTKNKNKSFHLIGILKFTLIVHLSIDILYYLCSVRANVFRLVLLSHFVIVKCVWLENCLAWISLLRQILCSQGLTQTCSVAKDDPETLILSLPVKSWGYTRGQPC